MNGSRRTQFLKKGPGVRDIGDLEGFSRLAATAKGFAVRYQVFRRPLMRSDRLHHQLLAPFCTEVSGNIRYVSIRNI